jgi:hypothetical protein
MNAATSHGSTARCGPHPASVSAAGTGPGGCGVAMTALFVPFTLAHGPTSYNEGREILGRDMLAWGLLLGVLPNVLIVAGLWWRCDKITGGGRGARVALMLSCVALLADAAVTLAFGGLAAPFVLFLLAPATIALAVLIPKGDAARARARVVLAGLGPRWRRGLPGLNSSRRHFSSANRSATVGLRGRSAANRRRAVNVGQYA